MELNQDKMKGTVNAAVGTFKQTAGRAVGDHNLEAEGAIQKKQGQAQKLSGSAQDLLKKTKTLLGIKPKKF